MLIVIKESGTFIHKHCCNSNHQPHTVKKCSQYRGTSDNMDEVNLTLSPASAIAASQEPWHSSFSIVTQLYFDWRDSSNFRAYSSSLFSQRQKENAFLINGKFPNVCVKQSQLVRPIVLPSILNRLHYLDNNTIRSNKLKTELWNSGGCKVITKV